jgi:hypothetical protein
MIITTANGHQFFVRVVFQGERYGLRDCLVHDKADPMVEFYDFTHAKRGPLFPPAEVAGFGARGQFVSSYNASTLAEFDARTALDLHSGEPLWLVDAEALRPVLLTARALTGKS